MTGFISSDPLNNLTSVYQRPIFIPANRPPTTNDVQPAGTQWEDGSASPKLIYITTGAGSWAQSGASASTLDTLTASSGGALTPVANNINILGTANQVTTTGSGATITLSTPAAFIAPGSIAATTTLTATAGAITATNGTLVLGPAGNKILSTSVGTTTAAGANAFGSVTLVAGTATVATTAVTASSLIHLSRQSVGTSTALGELTVGTKTAGTSFVISAATPATPGTPLASDTSVVFYQIIN